MSNTGQPPACHPNRSRYANRQCKSCYRAWYFKEHGVPLFDDVAQYGSSSISLREMWRDQKGLCRICQIPLGLGRRGMHIDHVDVDGEPRVRGLLCAGCNVGIAQLGHDSARLRSAAEYLEAKVPWYAPVLPRVVSIYDVEPPAVGEG